MYVRTKLTASLLICLGSALVGCSNPQGLDSVRVTPATQSVVVGQTVQFTATGTFGNANHPSTKDVTNSVSWSSTNTSVATVSSTGLVTGVGAGTANITASATAFNGPTSSTATLTVTNPTTNSSGSGAPGANILSLSIIPGSITVGNLQDTGQFLAIGTFASAPYTRDLTNSVQWITTAPNVFPVTTNCGSGAPANCSPAPLAGSQNGGVASAYGTGGAVIVAEYTDQTTKSTLTATATFNCPLLLPTATAAGTCYPGSQASALLSTLTVYNEGLNNNDPLSNNTNWLVTAPSATGICDPNNVAGTACVIHCGPGWTNDGHAGGSVCTATYPVGTTVTLTAPQQTGVKFGGWSQNCVANPPNPGVATGTNTCTVTLTSDATVGAIFN